MKRFFPVRAVLCASLLAPALAAAGSPGGLLLAVTWSPEAEPYVGHVRASFDRYDSGKGVNSCNDSQLNIDSATFDADRKKINQAAALAATSDPKKRKSFAKTMTAYRDKDHDEGLDGVLAIEKAGDKIVLRGIAAYEDEPVHAIVLRLDDVQKPAKLDQAVCRALVEIPVMREP